MRQLAFGFFKIILNMEVFCYVLSAEGPLREVPLYYVLSMESPLREVPLNCVLSMEGVRVY